MNKMEAMWQLCPKCSGQRQRGLCGIMTCNICNGKGIISVVNGLPPGGGSEEDGGKTRDWAIGFALYVEETRQKVLEPGEAVRRVNLNTFYDAYKVLKMGYEDKE